MNPDIPKLISEWMKSLSINDIKNLSDDEIVKMSIQRPDNPNQRGFLIDPNLFESKDEYSEKLALLMNRLREARKGSE